MPCGVTTKFGTVTVTCDNAGTSSHSGQHSAITTRSYFNFGYKVRVYWSVNDLRPTRVKPIIRGDYFAPLAEDDLPPPGGTFLTYDEQFPIDSTASIGSNWRAEGSTMHVSGGIARPNALGSGAGTNTWFATYTGGDVLGALGSDRNRVSARMVATGRGAATNMSCGLYLRGQAIFNVGTRVELSTFTGQASVIWSNTNGVSTQRATGSAVPANSTISFEAIDNEYNGYLNDSNTPFISWTDTGNVANVGANNRNWGFNTQANFPVFQRQFDSNGLDWIKAEDVSV